MFFLCCGCFFAVGAGARFFLLQVRGRMDELERRTATLEGQVQAGF